MYLVGFLGAVCICILVVFKLGITSRVSCILLGILIALERCDMSSFVCVRPDSAVWVAHHKSNVTMKIGDAGL